MWKPIDFQPVGKEYAAGIVSVCSGAGIGETGFEHSEKTPLRLAIAVEKHRQRARLLQGNFPMARVIQGDITERVTKDVVVKESNVALGGRRPLVVLMTPPCQGWSANGQGRLEMEPHEDPRNFVVVHCLDIVQRLNPAWVVFENVPPVRVKKLAVRSAGGRGVKLVPVVEYISNRLRRSGFRVHVSPVGFDLADWGIPQNRHRVFIIGEKLHLPPASVFPAPTHSRPSGTKTGARSKLKPWVTLARSIGPGSPAGRRLLGVISGADVSFLQAPNDQWHRVPRLAGNHVEWIRGLAPGESAFQRATCPSCGCADVSHRKVSIFRCVDCGSWLGKPLVKESGGYRPLHGFGTSYRRMWWDRPAPTVTTNSGRPSSDTKIHPDENRVLSLREIRILQTIDRYGHKWDSRKFVQPYYDRPGERWKDKRFKFTDEFYRQIAGEAIPPAFVDVLFAHLWELDRAARAVGNAARRDRPPRPDHAESHGSKA